LSERNVAVEMPVQYHRGDDGDKIGYHVPIHHAAGVRVQPSNIPSGKHLRGQVNLIIELKKN
jgi:hypothetical protein